MSFWMRYLLLILLCVIAPLGIGFYVDTQSEVSRAQRASHAAAEAAIPALNAQLTLEAHRLVGRALGLAQTITDERLAPQGKTAPRQEVLTRLTEVLGTETGRGGFAWVADETGTIVSRSAASGNEPAAERITGHPLFVATQRGFGLDGFWAVKDKVFFVGAAPLVKDGEARGAVLVGAPLDQDMVADLGKQIGTDLTVLADSESIASSLPSEVVESIIPRLAEETTGEPVHAGRRPVPLPSADLPFLPLFVSKDADGIAYTSVGRKAPGASSVRWVLSVPASEELAGLAERQQTILAVLVVATLLALVFGLTLSRSYVRPISLLVDHLAELQQGRGERELPEGSVSGPFRRLVKLINMTVQRIPTSTFGYADDSPRGPVASSAMDDSGDLGMAMVPSMPPSPPSPFGAPPLPAAASSQPSSPSRSASAVGRLTPVPQDLPGSGRVTPPPPAPQEPDGAAAAASEDRAASSRKVRSASQIRGTPSSVVGEVTGDLRGASSSRIPAAPGAEPAPRGASQAKPQQPEAHAALFAYLDELQAAPGAQAQDPFGAAESSPPPASRMGGSAATGAFGQAGISEEDEGDNAEFRAEATVVAAPQDYLIDASRREQTGNYRFDEEHGHDRTVVAETPEHLLEESKGNGPLDPSESAHFKETYERFLEMRRQCGEPTNDLAFDRFVAKLRKNRDGLIKKYNCKTVRFQVYEKDGKAALKATPVRS